MAVKILASLALCITCTGIAGAQTCKTNADVDSIKGKFQTAAEYPWPAVRSEYFKSLSGAADKATAQQVLGQVEKTEAQSHAGFTLTGGNWENIYASKGYGYLANTRVAQYNFESSLHEYFCLNGKPKLNDEAGTILRIYVNSIPVNTLNRFLGTPFGNSMGEYDYGFQYQDWKNHKPANVNDPLIRLFSYFSCSSEQLIKSMNSGEGYFQDVPDKDIRPNNRNNFIYRYWFIKKKDVPVLVPVSRKEYLESLLEYYDREKLHFSKLVANLTADHSSSVNQYTTWEADVTDKINSVKKALAENTAEWLQEPAAINRLEDNSQTYKAGLKEKTNQLRFWKFYTTEKKTEYLYRFNPAYCPASTTGPAKPQLIVAAFRYVSMPLSLKLLNNFTQNFEFDALRKMVQ